MKAINHGAAIFSLAGMLIGTAYAEEWSWDVAHELATTLPDPEFQPHYEHKFIEVKGHKICKSDYLVPPSDPTLLITTPGMLQIKTLWAGEPLEY